MSSKGISKWLIAGLPALMLAGCATTGDDAKMDESHFTMADSDSALGYEKSDWDKPFWEKWMDEARAEARASATPQPAAAPSAAVAGSQVAQPLPTAAGMRPKVGIYIAKGERDSLAAYRLMNALDQQAARHGLTLIKPDELDEAVGDSNACQADSPEQCPKLLSIYPGIRALLVVDPASKRDDQYAVETRTLDTDFSIDYDTVSTRLSLGGGDTNTSDAAVWADRMLGKTADRIAIAPWFTHSFALNGEDLYLSAGRGAGLALDDILIVHGEGAVVRSPGGQIVAWEPGPEVGRIQIKQLIGQNIAVAQSVSGRMPKPSDRLTVTKTSADS